MNSELRENLSNHYAGEMEITFSLLTYATTGDEQGGYTLTPTVGDDDTYKCNVVAVHRQARDVYKGMADATCIIEFPLSLQETISEHYLEGRRVIISGVQYDLIAEITLPNDLCLRFGGRRVEGGFH
jgi:hypothetical protein